MNRLLPSSHCMSIILPHFLQSAFLPSSIMKFVSRSFRHHHRKLECKQENVLAENDPKLTKQVYCSSCNLEYSLEHDFKDLHFDIYLVHKHRGVVQDSAQGGVTLKFTSVPRKAFGSCSFNLI